MFVLACVGASAAAGCAAAIETDATAATELVVGFPEGNVSSADLGPGQFAALLTREGLTGNNVDGRPLPRLADTWHWEDNGLTLRIPLREKVILHDGRPFTATVAADLLRENIAKPRTQALYPSLGDIRAIETNGDRELVFRLSQRSALLLEDLSLPLSTGDDGSIGTGPFRVQRENEQLVLERFDQYYQGTPAISRIVVRPFDTLRTAWSNLLRGTVDVVTDVPAEAVEFIRNDDVQVITYPRWYQFVVAFNSQRPVFRSPAVRRALNIAIDRDALIARVLKGRARPASGPLWPRHWAYDTSVQPYGYDPGQAASILDTAGFRRSASRRTTGVPNVRLRFTCLLPADFSVLERIGLELQKQLYDVGVDVQFEIVPLLEYDARLRKGDFDAVLVDMISGPGFSRPSIFWRSGQRFQGVSNFGYANAEAERLFEILRTTSTEAALRSATARLQRVFIEDPPALFLAWNERTRAVGKAFRVVHAPDEDPLLTMWRWDADRHNSPDSAP